MAAITAAYSTHIGTMDTNQDRVAVTVTPTCTQLAVFDGHGTYGEEMATWAAEHTATVTDKPLTDLFSDLQTHLYDSTHHLLIDRGIGYIEEHGAFYHRRSTGVRGSAIRGGTTASIVRIANDGGVLVANVGDSDVLVFDSDYDPGQVLTADHSTTSETEWRRVHAAHPATEFRFSGTAEPVFRPTVDGWRLNSRYGIMQCDVRGSLAAYLVAADNSEQLAMTRALGDFNLRRHGVSSDPDFGFAPAPPAGTKRVVIAASDGLWDAVHYHEARDIVRALDDPNVAANALVEFGMSRSRALFGSVDNISVAVAYCLVPNINLL